MKKTITMLSLLIALAATCTANPKLTSARHSAKTYADVLTDDRFQTLVSSLPDHGLKGSPRKLYTKEFYDVLVEAYAIPGGGLVDIGNDEFLYYLVCGNDPCETHSGQLKDIVLDGDTAYVEFNIVHTNVCEPIILHTMKLVLNYGKWIIADYDDNLAEIRKYIVEQREYLRSAEYKEQAAQILNDPKMEEDLKDRAREELREVEKYFREYP